MKIGVIKLLMDALLHIAQEEKFVTLTPKTPLRPLVFYN